MAVTAGAVVPLDDRRRRHQDLLAELREVDHWRRLVTARLDLAVATVTALDEPGVRCGPGSGAPMPGLWEIVGLPSSGTALQEANVLVRLRTVQRELDDRARRLRACAEPAWSEVPAWAEVIDALDLCRSGARQARSCGPVHHHDGLTGDPPWLRLVTDPGPPAPRCPLSADEPDH
jgi:hypothetical protein